jgi:DNA-binding NtrC family response regulator
MAEEHKRILIVDDELDVLGCLEEVLARDGYRTER